MQPSQLTEAEQLELEMELADMESASQSGLGDTTPRARAIERLGGVYWAKTIFPSYFNRPFAEYQKESWKWAWSINSDTRYRPRVECQPRGVGKSTSAEAIVAALVARHRRRMIGYVSMGEKKSTKHFDSIRAMFETPQFINLYPHCRPQVQTLRQTASQWSRKAIVTASSAMVVPLSLTGSSRGWKSPVGARFDMLVLDDIDELGMSIDVIRKCIELLKSEILAAGDDKTLVLVPQNLIHRYSIVQGIYDKSLDLLIDRVFCGPYPILKGQYEAERQDIGDGGERWKITRAEPFDAAISVEYAESLLTLYGKDVFDRECQHDVMKVDLENDFTAYDEIYHIITYSEFADYFDERYHVVNQYDGTLTIPTRWQVGRGLDWGTTPLHPSVCAFITKPDQTSPLADSHFLFAEVCLPPFPKSLTNESMIVSPGVVADAIRDTGNKWALQDGQIVKSEMSHEASAALNSMIQDLAEDRRVFFGKWKAQKGSGVPQIQNQLKIDKSQPHPFRKFPAGFTINGVDVGGRAMMGRPRFYIVVPDDQGALFVDGGRLCVNGAKDSKGMARTRYEIPLYSFRNSGQKKIDDDAVDAIRGLMSTFGVNADPETQSEKIDRRTEAVAPLELLEKIAETAPERYSTAFTQRAAIMNRIRVQVEAEDNPEDYGNFIG